LNPARGEIWWANLEPIVGSEQGGRRPVLVLQTDLLAAFTSTVIAVNLGPLGGIGQHSVADYEPIAHSAHPAPDVLPPLRGWIR
jgi:hypothetical protein